MSQSSAQRCECPVCGRVYVGPKAETDCQAHVEDCLSKPQTTYPKLSSPLNPQAHLNPQPHLSPQLEPRISPQLHQSPQGSVPRTLSIRSSPTLASPHFQSTSELPPSPGISHSHEVPHPSGGSGGLPMSSSAKARQIFVFRTTAPRVAVADYRL